MEQFCGRGELRPFEGGDRSHPPKAQDIFESHVPCLPRMNQYTGHRAGVTRRRDGKVGDSGAERAAAVQL
jgi:hypothetical protein